MSAGLEIRRGCFMVVPCVKVAPSVPKTFKETYGWQRRMTHGEAEAADQVGIESSQQVLPQYDADDIYNADETALM